jgi:hypothetical protein
MNIVHRGLILAFSSLLLVLSWTVYEPRQGPWRDAATWGSATPEVRAAVISQLRAFQNGYTRRDPTRVSAFMDRLFSRDHPVVLGPLPSGIFVGYEAASKVIRHDWAFWGRYRFQTSEAQVSSAGNVAWFATVGSVTSDLSRFLVLPLRLSGVMVNEKGAWKLRQAQLQYDLHLGPLLALQLALLVWTGVNLVWLPAAVLRRQFAETNTR